MGASGIIDAMRRVFLAALVLLAVSAPWSAPSVAASVRDRFEVPSLGISVTTTKVSCEDLSGPLVPEREKALFGDCSAEHGFYAVVGRDNGPLRSLGAARAGTVVYWWDGQGKRSTRHLAKLSGKAYQNADGTWPGHGVPPGDPLFVDIRGHGQETEREGDRCRR